jgi:hypothetical protein
MDAKNEYYKSVEEGQDVYDLCLQEYGDINTIFLLLEDNPALDLTRALIAGEQMKFRVELPDEVKVDKKSMDDFRTKTIRVNGDEQELLVDGVYNTTVGGAIDSTLPDLTPVGAGGQTPNTLTGVQTANGNTIRTRLGALLLLRQAPVLLTRTQHTLLNSTGTTISVRQPVFTYLTTNSGAYIQSANNRYLLTR